MKCGFVILNYNSWDLTKKLALSVSKYEKIDYVIVIDNCSSNDSYFEMKDIENNKIVVKKTEKNGGYSYGNNYGAKVCSELGIDIMFISNPDVEIDESDINLILKGMNDVRYSVLTGVEYDINGIISDPPIWKLSSYKDDLLDCFYIGRKISKKNIKVNYMKKIQDIDIFKGSLFAVRLKDYLDVGGFDESVFLFCEERILSTKIKKSGKSIGLVTGARYYHRHSETINKEYKKIVNQIKIQFESRMIYYNKYKNITKFKNVVLKIAMKWSLFEYRIYDLVKLIKRKVN